MLRNIIHYFSYNMHHTQELLDMENHNGSHSQVRFLIKMVDDLSFPWNILWSDESHFYLNGAVNIENCVNAVKKISRMYTEIPLHSSKMTVWYWIMMLFILLPYFLEERTARCLVRCFVTGRRYNDMLQTFVLQQLQQMWSLHKPFFCKDGARSHIHEFVMAVLLQ